MLIFPCSFDAIVSADLFKNLKPAPDIFLAAADKLGLPPEQVRLCSSGGLVGC